MIFPPSLMLSKMNQQDTTTPLRILLLPGYRDKCRCRCRCRSQCYYSLAWCAAAAAAVPVRSVSVGKIFLVRFRSRSYYNGELNYYHHNIWHYRRHRSLSWYRYYTTMNCTLWTGLWLFSQEDVSIL